MLCKCFLLLKLVAHRRQTCACFRASFYDNVLASYCSVIAGQHVNVETCSKTCASFLSECLRKKITNTAMYSFNSPFTIFTAHRIILIWLLSNTQRSWKEIFSYNNTVLQYECRCLFTEWIMKFANFTKYL